MKIGREAVRLDCSNGFIARWQMSEQRIGKKDRKHNPFGAAHVNARDAYRDVPVLKQPTWNNEVAAYFFFGGVSAGR